MGTADTVDMDQNPYEVLQLEKEHESSEADIKKVHHALLAFFLAAERSDSLVCKEFVSTDALCAVCRHTASWPSPSTRTSSAATPTRRQSSC
jgi:hypothetical protein